MNPLTVDLKQTMNQGHYYKKIKNNRKDNCTLYSSLTLPSLTGVTFLQPEQVWIPRLQCPGLQGGEEDVIAYETPFRPVMLFPLCVGTQFQMQLGLPRDKPSLCIQDGAPGL